MHAIFTALQFRTTPDGRVDYTLLHIPAETHEQAKTLLFAESDCAEANIPLGEVYLQTDDSIAELRAHNVSPILRIGAEGHDRPTIEAHRRWVEVMARDRTDDEGCLRKAVYARIH